MSSVYNLLNITIIQCNDWLYDIFWKSDFCLVPMQQFVYSMTTTYKTLTTSQS